MDTTTIGVFVGGTIAIIVFFCYALINNFRQSKRTHQWLNLHQPLHPSAIDLRLDAALRDAEDGFNRCDACQFENLKRNIFCTLCGAPVIDIIQTTDKIKRKDKTKIKDKLLVRDHLASTSANSRRQARALKRKEWTLQVNADNKLIWRYDDSLISSGMRPRGFVLRFMGDPLVKKTKHGHTPSNLDDTPNEAQKPEATPSSDDHVALTIENDSDHTQTIVETPGGSSSPEDEGDGNSKPTMRLLALDVTHDQLRGEIESHPLQLVESLEATPSRPVIVLDAEPIFPDEPALVVTNSQLNFPSKLAEFIARTSATMMLSDQSFLKLRIHRGRLLEDSLLALAATPPQCSRCPIRMTFVGEQGIDAGGVYREWVVLVNERIIAPDAGIFRCVDTRDRLYYLNPTSEHDLGEHHLAHVFAAGRLIGRMLLEGNVTGFHLALPLLKIIVGQPVTFDDLEYFDVDAHKNLLWLLENEGVEALGLDFTVTEQTVKGETIVVNLVPNGSEVEVTDVNKHEYVNLKFQYLLFGSVQNQLFAFLKGIYEVMPAELLMMFDAEELDYVLSGSDEIDVDDWERNSKYTEDLVEHPVRRWFWELVREMPNEYRRRLLLFATGSSRIPLAGFSALTSYDGRLCPFMLNGMSLADGGEYIQSHACFNRLDLPRYGKKKDLKAVLYGILDTELYGFTTA